MTEFTDIACPYCGETIEVAVDVSAGSQTYTEDCQVCCRPMVMRLVVDEGDDTFSLAASSENDG
ncbi:CPXCG motif-containing cysteine-rich protein [Luteibacter sp. PPL201]|jgi:transcription elongation factor Elf1|uniref:CPXCG motif-containing cysteine-rich protein n=1 Tax=Luteibacter sahnii TaxID=3021977 RepID=A0ABT6BCV0_9GAMM|nr:CPXCG motif-containing cysteine-rich protein [Luteibacter sp. PPL193]MDY1549859.1 CPXCG motif-containing cysteine-rich protein [Luteibacter sp. PPL193]